MRKERKRGKERKKGKRERSEKKEKRKRERRERRERREDKTEKIGSEERDPKEKQPHHLKKREDDYQKGERFSLLLLLSFCFLFFCFFV